MDPLSQSGHPKGGCEDPPKDRSEAVLAVPMGCAEEEIPEIRLPR